LPLPVVSLTRTVKSIVVAWTYPAEEQPRITGFPVVAEDPQGQPVACSPQPGVDTRSCTLTGLADATAYEVTVTALAASGVPADNAAGSATVATAGVADPPTLAQPTAQDTAITATWTPGADNGSYATSYEVEVLRADPAMPGPASLTCTVTDTSCTATGTRGATYTVRVRAVNLVGPSAWSQPASVVVAAVAPGAPSLDGPTRSGTEVSVAWTPGADNGAPVSAYTVTVTGSDGDAPTCAPTTATGCRFTGVRGSTYAVSVTATNAAGTSAPSNSRQIAVPAAVPTPVVTARPGSAALVVSWEFPVGDEGRIDGFTVVVQPSGAVCQAVLTPSTRTCRVDGLQNGTAYTATVTAVAAGGDRADDVSAQGAATPVTLAVTAVTVAGPGTLTVRWQFPTGDENRITGFRVSAGAAACAPALLDVTVRTCRITGLDDGTQYPVTVRAVSPTGDDRDDAVSTGTATPAPLPLTGPHVDRGNGTLTVSWTYPADREDRITGFQVTAGQFSCGPLAPSARSCVLGGLTNGTLYTVTVVAVAGSGFPDDNAWGSASGRPSAGAPGSPTGVGAVPGDAAAQVSWTAPAQVGQGVAGYRVSAVPDGGGTPVECPATDALTCAVALTNGVTYRVTVTTVGVDGDSPPSEPVVVTPAAPVPLPVSVPTVVAGTLASSDGAAFPVAGATTVLTGAGFAPNTTVTLAIYSAPTPLGTAVTDDQGAFRQTVTIPAGFSGRHTFVSIGLDPSGTVRVLALAVSVGGTAAGGAPAGGGGGLAITGLPVSVLVLTGLGLLAAGAASRAVGSVPVRYGRRRRRA
jgi:titin